MRSRSVEVPKVKRICRSPTTGLPELGREARMLFRCLTHDLGTQVKDVRVKKGLMVDIVPDILPHLGTEAVPLRSATGALSAISAVLEQQAPGQTFPQHHPGKEGLADCKARYEAEAGEAMERAKACPLCAEQGHSRVIHTHQRRHQELPTPMYIDWPSYMITGCPVFTAMKPHSGAANGGVAGNPLPVRYSLGSAPPTLNPTVERSGWQRSPLRQEQNCRDRLEQ